MLALRSALAVSFYVHMVNFLVSSCCFSSSTVRLTAYVLQSFLQAESYIQINHSVLSRATAWLINQQGADGKFREVGRVINTELQEALDKDSVALTAYALITLLKNQTYKVREQS